jgi:GntR family transcriptional regulator
MLTRDNRKALVHEQAKQQILLLIEERGYIAGDRIPSERDLSERFGIHRMTLRKAIDNLIADGVLERRGTSGTYIPTPVVIRPVSRSRPPQSISEIVEGSGGKPGSKLLFFEQNEASVRAAEKLNVAPGDPLIVIKRLRIIDDLPFCIETTWLPSRRVPGLAAHDLFGDISFYALLESRYGIKAGRSQATLSAGKISGADAEILGTEPRENVLVLHSVVHDVDGVPIEYMSSLNHPRRVLFTVE